MEIYNVTLAVSLITILANATLVRLSSQRVLAQSAHA